MSKERIRNRREAAEELGVNVKTITDIVRARGIVRKPLPYNGFGLDDSDMAEIREALGMAEVARSA